MLPKAFLTTFWELDFRPEVFVAMSFDPAYESRFVDIYKPAIEGISVNGKELRPNRVDLSKSGDSILTEIIDGIAHCQFFLADISMIDRGARSSEPFRNGNVMYEVGIALSCRNPSEILLVRDDMERTLFDISMVPHMHIDFSNSREAMHTIKEQIEERIKLQKFEDDLRLETTIATLSPDEYQILCTILNDKVIDKKFPFGISSGPFGAYRASIKGLLEKRIVKRIKNVIGEDGHPLFEFTQLGSILASKVIYYKHKSDSIRELTE